MRLPADAALIVVDAPPPTEDAITALLTVWREEGLPVFHVAAQADSAFVDTGLEAALDAIGATTLVVCGNALDATVRDAAGLGYRVFLVADAHAPALARQHGEYAAVVSSETALEAGRRAKARLRWRAQRGGA